MWCTGTIWIPSPDASRILYLDPAGSGSGASLTWAGFQMVTESCFVTCFFKEISAWTIERTRDGLETEADLMVRDCWHYICCRFNYLTLLYGYLVMMMQQENHQSGDWVARRWHILCSICFHSFGALAKDVRFHCITSQPASVSWNVLYWHFRQPSNKLAEIWLGVRNGPIR